MCAGFAYDVVNAVLAAGADDVRDAIARAEALTAARESDGFRGDFGGVQAHQKYSAAGGGEGICAWVGEGREAFGGGATACGCGSGAGSEVAKLRQERAYGEALALIATLRPVVDAFFDKVMVLDPDEKVRGAHLGLIDGVLRGFSGIADFSEIVTG